jgi:hypothetical protein
MLGFGLSEVVVPARSFGYRGGWGGGCAVPRSRMEPEEGHNRKGGARGRTQQGRRNWRKHTTGKDESEEQRWLEEEEAIGRTLGRSLAVV